VAASLETDHAPTEGDSCAIKLDLMPKRINPNNKDL
jgi:hypothetical protein